MEYVQTEVRKGMCITALFIVGKTRHSPDIHQLKKGEHCGTHDIEGICAERSLAQTTGIWDKMGKSQEYFVREKGHVVCTTP